MWYTRNMEGKWFRLVLGAALWFLYACNSENAPDCLQNTGDVVRDEVVLPPFDKITVFEEVGLVLREGADQRVEIQTGEFLRDEVTAMVEGDRLLLRNTNGCNLFRSYGETVVFVTAPNITEIRSSTGRTIRSDGPLSYPRLTLLSESFAVPEAATTDGAFDLELRGTRLDIIVNGIAYFRLKGTAARLGVTIAAGDSRVEAEDLLADTVNINHRGSNDILIHPLNRLDATLRGTGDVLSFNRPPVVEVSELFTGRLRFRE